MFNKFYKFFLGIALVAVVSLGTVAAKANTAPNGFIDILSLNTACNFGDIRVQGWTKSGNEQVNVLVEYNGQLRIATQANRLRPDVGGNFGYNVSITMTNNEVESIKNNPSILGVYGVNASGQKTRLSPSNSNYIRVASSGCPASSSGNSTTGNANTQTSTCPDGQGNTGSGCRPCTGITGVDGKNMLYGEAVKTCVSQQDCQAARLVNSNGRCVSSSSSNNSGNSSIPTTPTTNIPSIGVVKWNGFTRTYNQQTKTWVDTGSDNTGAGFRDTNCSGIDSGKYTTTCNTALSMTGGKPLYAYRFKYILDVSYLSPQDRTNYYSSLGVNASSNLTTVTFEQQMYTYFNTATNSYVTWFYIDRNGNVNTSTGAGFWNVTVS